MGFLESREDYINLGLDPPNRQLNQQPGDPDIRSNPDTHIHKWAQIGNEVYCEAGNNRHGFLVDPTKILIGTGEEGEPLYKIIDNDALMSKDIN